jgi:hypothetical protein
MIKMAGRNDQTGRSLIVLGIDEDNVRQLKKGHPIHVYADDLGFAGEIVIHYESTLERLKKRFMGFVGPNTRFTDNSAKPDRN